MVSAISGALYEYDRKVLRSDVIVRLKTLRVNHPEHIRRVLRQIAMETLCSVVEIPSEVWTKYNSIYWHQAGAVPPKSLREGTMTYRPVYEQMSLEEAIR